MRKRAEAASERERTRNQRARDLREKLNGHRRRLNAAAAARKLHFWGHMTSFEPHTSLPRAQPRGASF